jgi:hypothetical protein
MNTKLDEIMSTYANILSTLPETPAVEPLWHATVELPDVTPDLDVAQISLQTNAFVSTAADKKERDILREKLRSVEIKDMVGEAHPEPVYIADAMEDGGLVENGNELHQKLVEMINKYPSGSVGHKYAALAEDLLTVAQELDATGDSSAAQELDSLANSIVDALKKNSNLTKVALIWTVPMVMWGLGAILGTSGAAWYGFKGQQENLARDLDKLAGNVDSWKDDSAFAAFKSRIYQLREVISRMQASTNRWVAASDIYANQKTPAAMQELQSATEDLQKAFSDYKPLRDEIIDVKLAGAFFPAFKWYESNVMEGYNKLMGFAQEQGTRLSQQSDGQHADQFDSPEMQDAEHAVEEADTSSRQPLDKNATMQAQLFINRAYQPIGVASGLIDDAWYKGIKAMVDSLRGRLQQAVAAQDPDAAAETAMDLNISKFVEMDSGGNYALLVSAAELNRIFNLVDLAEEQVKALRSARVMQPHESLLQ